jgi:putative ABC transport system substrate-binding protein
MTRWKYTRRQLIALVGGAAMVGPLAAAAQQPAKVPLIGWLWFGRPGDTSAEVKGFKEGLRELGYVEGRNIRVEYRFSGGDHDRLPALAAELVALEPDVIVAVGSTTTRAAQGATKSIPIVMLAGDPLGAGVVQSLARPGGNTTGVSMQWAEGLAGKWVEVLRDALPGVARVGMLWDARNPTSRVGIQYAERAAADFGLTTHPAPVQHADDLAGAFAAMARERVEGLVIASGDVTIANIAGIAQLARKHRIPAIAEVREFVAAGGLLSYGASVFDTSRQLARLMDKILKGADPGGLPVQQPIKFILVINLKIAGEFGLTIPSSFQLRADEVIE